MQGAHKQEPHGPLEQRRRRDLELAEERRQRKALYNDNVQLRSIIHRYEDEMSRAHEEIRDLRQQLATAHEQASQQPQQRPDAEFKEPPPPLFQQHPTVDRAMYEQKEKAREMLERQNAELNMHLERLAADLKFQEDEKARVADQYDTLTSQGKQQKVELEDRQRRLDASDRENRELLEEKHRYERKCQSLHEAFSEMDQKLRDTETKLQRTDTENRRLQAVLQEISQERDQVERELGLRKDELRNTAFALQEQKSKNMSWEQRCTETDQEVRRVRQKLFELHKEYQNRGKQCIGDLNRQHTGHLEQLQQKLKVEEVEKSGLQASLARAQFNLQLERDEKLPTEQPTGVPDETVDALHSRLSAVTQDRDCLQRQVDSLRQQHRRESRNAEQELEQLRASEKAAKRRVQDVERAATERLELLGEKEKETARLQARMRALTVEHEEATRKLREDVQSQKVEWSAEVERLRAQKDELELGRRSDKKRFEQATRDADEEVRRLQDDASSLERLREEDQLRHRDMDAQAQRRLRELEESVDATAKEVRQLRSERRILEIKCERQKNGIENIKGKLKATDSCLGDVQGSREQMRVDLRDTQLALEQERIERKRLEREYSMLEQEHGRYRSSLAYWENEAARLQEREQQRPLLRIAEKPSATRTRRKRQSSAGPRPVVEAKMPEGPVA